MKMTSLQTDRKHRRIKVARYKPIDANTTLLTQQGKRYCAGNGVTMKRKNCIVSSKMGIVRYRHIAHGKVIVSVVPMDSSLGMNHEKFIKKAGINGQSLFDYLSVNGAVVKEDFIPLNFSERVADEIKKAVTVKLNRSQHELVLENLDGGYRTVFGIGALGKKARRRMSKLAQKEVQR
jgi:ribosomal protein L27